MLNNKDAVLHLNVKADTSRHVAISGLKDDDDMWRLDSCYSGRRTAADSLKRDPQEPGKKNEPWPLRASEAGGGCVPRGWVWWLSMPIKRGASLATIE